jgi:nucleoside-diphosphate-sugar epimerase
MSKKFNHVYVTGGAGYVGSRLVPRLLDAGFKVSVLDLFLFGEDVFDEYTKHPLLRCIKGDMRDRTLLEQTIPGCDAIIHLACISNDPSFELDPALGKSINYDCFPDLVEVCKSSGVKRFVYASSSSVYGVKSEQNVTEDLPLEPLTDYSKYKALCEDVLLKARAPGFVTFIVRPATVCGYAKRLRLDLTVNILTNHAMTNKKIVLFGGGQMRPNIHIEDMCDLYLQSLEWSDEAIDGKIFNAGFDNFTVAQIGEIVREVVGNDVQVVIEPTNDNRSYHISSEKIKRELGFVPKRSIRDAVVDLVSAFEAGKIPNSMTDSRYYNIKTMQAAGLK